MGEARRRALIETHTVTVEFQKVQFTLSRPNRQNLIELLTATYPEDEAGHREQRVAVRVGALLCAAVIAEAFKDGMAKQDGKHWAAWQEVFEEDDPAPVMAWGQIEWLRKLVGKEDLKIRPDFAQWREALVSYLDTLSPASESHDD